VLDLILHKHLVVPFFTALLLSLCLTPCALRLSLRIGAMDRPDDRKIHGQPVPSLGGLAIAIALLATICVFFQLDRKMLAFVTGALVALATGLIDDIYHIHPAMKFLGGVLGSVLFLIIGGMTLDNLGNLFGFGDLLTGRLAPFLTVFCMTGVMNAFNLSDGLDGLAGGISAIACIFLGIYAYLHNDGICLSILVVLLGATLGFLRYNMHPATVFMGDTGSMLLGYSLSAVSVMMVQPTSQGVPLAPVTVAAVLALPILDTLLVMLRRILRGSNPFLPDRVHLHHRLLDMGFPHVTAVSILYLCTGSFGILSMAMQHLSEGKQLLAVLLCAGAIYGVVFLLQLCGYHYKTSRPSKSLSLEGVLKDALSPNRDTNP